MKARSAESYRTTRAEPRTYTHVWSTLGNFSDNPMGINWIGIVFGLGAVISMGYWTTDFLVVQRVLSAKDLRSAKMAPIIGAAFKMMVPFIVILPGLLGLALLRDPHGSLLRLVPADSHGPLKDRRRVSTAMTRFLPLMLARYCGPGLLGLGITALIAGFMSGMAGNVSAFTTVWTYDIYRRPDQQECHRTIISEDGPLVSRFSALLVSIGTAYLVMHAPEHHGLRPVALQLLHRAAVWHGDSRHAVEACDPGRRLDWACWPAPLSSVGMYVWVKVDRRRCQCMSRCRLMPRIRRKTCSAPYGVG